MNRHPHRPDRPRRRPPHPASSTRTFPAPIEDVWAAVTEPERLERWIGTLDRRPGDRAR